MMDYLMNTVKSESRMVCSFGIRENKAEAKAKAKGRAAVAVKADNPKYATCNSKPETLGELCAFFAYFAVNYKAKEKAEAEEKEAVAVNVDNPEYVTRNFLIIKTKPESI